MFICRCLFVDAFRVFQDRIDRGPCTVLQHAKKAAVPTGVAGDAGLMAQLGDLEQHHVVVAVHADFVHLLHMAGLFALVPKLVARAAEIHRLAQFGRLLQGLAVHPREHQHIARGLLLGDHRDQAFGIPANVLDPVGRSGVCGCHLLFYL